LLAQTGEGYTACLLAFVNKHVETVNKLFAWAEETHLNKRELIKNAFPATNKNSSIECNQEAERGTLEELEILWSWVKVAEINTGEFLEAQTGEGEISFKLATDNNFIETLKKMWVWAEEKQNNTNNLKKKL
jgi:hypothetical protein